MYTGRFAPSPSGALHFGSLVAALASWLDARAARGRWLVRIEDLDRPRVQAGARDAILDTLQRLGLDWDGEVVYQSRREALYREALEALRGETYGCACSRREIADSSLGLAVDGARIYPGTCRAGLGARQAPRALRVRVGEAEIGFVDRVQGAQAQVLSRDVGDFVVRRAGGQFAYQLAAAVDDAAQGVTDVVRGADLLDSTARQIHLQRLLGVATPRYLHVPVAVNERGEKLSKQTGAPPVDATAPRQAMAAALAFLGQPPAASLDQAVKQWDVALIPSSRARAAAR